MKWYTSRSRWWNRHQSPHDSAPAEGNTVIYRTAWHRVHILKVERSWLVAPSFSAGIETSVLPSANLVIPESAAAGGSPPVCCQVEGLQELVIQADIHPRTVFTGGMV